MALEDFGDLVDRSQAHIIPKRPIEPNHHVLDHGELTLPTPKRWFRRRPVPGCGNAICR
jgi:hypothetical protein